MSLSPESAFARARHLLPSLQRQARNLREHPHSRTPANPEWLSFNCVSLPVQAQPAPQVGVHVTAGTRGRLRGLVPVPERLVQMHDSQVPL